MASKTKIGLPKIKISMTQTVRRSIERSSRGIVVLLVRDETAGVHSYATLAELLSDKELYTAKNYQYITDALAAGPYSVTVITLATDDMVADVLSTIDELPYTGRIVMPDATSEETAEIIEFVKASESAENSWHALVYGAAQPDCRHVEALSAKQVTAVQWTDADRADSTAAEFLPRLEGVLSACNVMRSATNYELSDIAGWTTASGVGKTDDEIESEIDAGFLCLYSYRGTISIARGVNTLQTVDETENTNDMRFSDIVETVDLVRDDIRELFRNNYLGKKKNDADNQGLFCGDVNTYLKLLQDDKILDTGDEYGAEIDVDAMRRALAEQGEDTAALTDAQIKQKTIGRQVYLKLYIKPLRAMEGLTVAGTLE